MRINKDRVPGFDVRPGPQKGAVVTITCAKCGKPEDINVPTDFNPEAVRNQFTNKGWQANFRVKRKNRCPECAGHIKHHDDNQEEEVHMEHAMQDAASRQLDKPQRQKVRDLLDTYFDEDRGCFTDGYSDQKIGKEVGVPWALVTTLRETAYGPILVDPAVDELRSEHARIENDLEGAKKMVEEALQQLSKAEERLDKSSKEMIQVLSRIDGLQRRRA